MRYFDESAVTNPCSDDDFADLPHPIYFWYDWQPDRHDHDADGNAFDCREWLRPGSDYFGRTLSLTQIAPPKEPTSSFADLREHLGGLRREYAATLILGVLDHAWPRFDYRALRREIGLSGNGARLRSRARDARARATPRERAEAKLLDLLADVHGTIDVHRYDSSVEEGALRVTLTGRLRASAHPVRLTIHLGLTDIFGPTPPAHWSTLRRALVSDDLILYAGHSGIGENVRLAQVEEGLHLPRGTVTEEYRHAPRHQIVGFLSCYSYMYFGQDMLASLAQSGDFSRDFVFTGNAYTTGDRGALLVLDFVDRLFPSSHLSNPTLGAIAPGDFLLWKTARP